MSIKKEETDKPQPKKNNLGAAPEKRVLKGKEGSIKAKRTAARLAAVQVLYQMALNEQGAKEALKDFIQNRIGFKLDGEVFVPADEDLLKEIVLGVSSRLEDINNIMQSVLANGGRGNVELLLGNIIRAGIYELMADSKVDAGIIINDYMNVTNGFYEGSETKIVNAVLDKVSKQVRE